MRGFQFFIPLILGIILAIQAAESRHVVCYFGSWSVYRPGNGKFLASDIDPKLCSHIIYSFIGLNTDGSIKILDNSNDVLNGGFKKFIALKKKNPKVKLLVAMGGWSEGSEKYSKVFNSANLRKKLVSNVLKFVMKWNFDGFDLDWEYPAQRGGAASDKKVFITFLKELRNVFKDHGLLITAAVGAGDYLTESSYDIPKMNQYLDFINLMTYDFASYGDGKTGHNAPIKQIENTVKTWIRLGASPQKLILGIPVYGRTFTLTSSSNNNLGAAVSKPGKAGPYTGEAGLLSYQEICEDIDNWTQKWDNTAKVPYAFKGNQWISYDNKKSVEIKAQYAVKQKLGGFMIWSVDQDDADGICGDGRYPILKTLNKYK